MQNNSCQDRIRDLLATWKMISTSDLKLLLHRTPEFNQRTFEWSLLRLRKKGEIYSLRIGPQILNFHSKWKKRYALFLKNPSQRRELILRQTGLFHHLELLRIYLEVQKEVPDWIAYPNLSNQSCAFTQSIQGRRLFPDLILRKTPASSALYIEFERTLKSEKRYRERWRSYERDRSIYGCLYWLEEPSHLGPLLELSKAFFDRKSGRAEFHLSFVLDVQFRQNRLDTQIYRVGLNRREEISLREVLQGPVPAPVAIPYSKNFSAPTTYDDLAISALRANSSPPTSSNDWVLKDGREEFARRAP